jgi:hypothetical protein
MSFRFKFDSRIIRADTDEAANRKIPAKFGVLLVVHVMAEVFWEVTPRRLVNVSYLVSVAEITPMVVSWMLANRWAGYVATCRGKVHTGFLSGNLSERDHLKDQGIDRTIIKCTFKK